MRVTALNLPDELVTRLDSFAAADGRSRSNAARLCLEAALNAEAQFRQQASEHFTKLQNLVAPSSANDVEQQDRAGVSSSVAPARIFSQMPGCFDPQSAAGDVPFSSGGMFPGGGVSHQHSNSAVDEAVELAPASSADFQDPYEKLKADNLRAWSDAFLERLYPQKPKETDK